MSDLDQLDNVAHAADAGAAIADGTAEQGTEGALAPAGPDYAGQAAAGLDLLTGMIAGYAPETAQVFTPECKGRIVAAAVPVMEKYAFTFDKVPPEIVLLAVAGPPMYQAARLVATRMEHDKRAAQAKAVTAQPKPDASGIEKAAAMPAHTAPAPERHAQEKLYGAE